MTSTLDIAQFLEELKRGTPLFDVRSPKEFTAGHIPGAISLPLLNDDERHRVGIVYKEDGRDAAVSLGYQLVGHKFIDYIEAARNRAVDGKVALHCWRGGIRSNTMAWLMASVGLQVFVLEGGYKEFRQWCLKQFQTTHALLVLSGKTGAGKTEVLHALRSHGESVVDLESLANHRGSAFGGLGLPAQPTQEAFENLLAWELGTLQGAKRIWMENESRFIGRVRIPDAFFLQSNQAPLISIDRDVQSRASRIIAEYGVFDNEILAEKTIGITKRMGGDRVKASIEALDKGDRMGWVLPLLDYYDRNYAHAIQMREGKQQHVLSVTTEGAYEIAQELLRRMQQ
ncbi:MAG: tRNA 2-selenouridine(34) synthase MnmH [Flavobacteriales bacterium]